MSHQPRIAVVVGSTRPGRISLDVARWAEKTLSAGSELRYEVVDLADVALPMLDEPVPAAYGRYRTSTPGAGAPSSPASTGSSSSTRSTTGGIRAS